MRLYKNSAAHLLQFAPLPPPHHLSLPDTTHLLLYNTALVLLSLADHLRPPTIPGPLAHSIADLAFRYSALALAFLILFPPTMFATREWLWGFFDLVLHLHRMEVLGEEVLAATGRRLFGGRFREVAEVSVVWRCLMLPWGWVVVGVVGLGMRREARQRIGGELLRGAEVVVGLERGWGGAV